jgi:hypothetical protein
MLMIINVKSELYQDFTGLEIHLYYAQFFISKNSPNENLVYLKLAKIEKKLTSEQLKYLH